jgi:3-oxoacyl-[acyl-carrier protein] reductase
MTDSTAPIALVTGASRGIGRAIALQLAADGYDMAFCYRQCATAGEEVAAAIRARGGRAFHRACDVGDPASVAAFLDDVAGALGPLSLLVNCAGITRDNPLVLMDQQAWDEVMRVNLDAVFHVCRHAVFGFMKRKRGCIINISSVAGVYGHATQANYSAAKAGVIGFSKSLAKEVGPYGVRVNVVAPGFITSDMTAALGQTAIDQMIPSIPLRRVGEAHEVADLVSFLASPRAGYITGQTIHVDGGIVL